MKKVAVIGVGQTKFRTRNDNFTHAELTYQATKLVLDDAGLRIDDISAIVYGTMDPFDGINQPEKWCSTGAGAYNKPFMKISTGGTTGMTLGLAAYQHCASGMFDIVMAIGTQRVGTADDAQSIINTCVDPIFEREVGQGAISVGAVQASRHMYKYGSTDEQRAYISVKDHKNAIGNPYAHIKQEVTIEDVLNSRMIEWPLRLYECCPRSDGACAVIYANEDVVKNNPQWIPAWVIAETGISDNYFWGDRPDFADWDSLAIAGRKLYKLAHITNPLKEISVAELYTPFTSQHILETEALGFCNPGEGGIKAMEGVFDMEGELPTNPSGGVLCTNPIGITGLVRLADASLQVRGKAGETQVKDVDIALAHAWGGTAQFHALILLGREKR